MEYIFSLAILGILLPIAIAGKSMAPWVPTRRKDIQRLLNILEIKSGDKFLEIGCGDGRVSLAVGKHFPKVSITGIELAYPMYIIAKMRQIFSGSKNVHICLANAFKQDFSQYQHVYVYGMPNKMGEKIVPKFLKEAPEGAKLYSYIFSIPDEYKNHTTSYGGESEAKIHVLEKK